MGQKYYYLVASLPIINFDSKPSISVKEFLSDCKRLLHAEDYELLSMALSGKEHYDKTTNNFLNTWIEFNRSCCNEMACFRSLKKDKDPSSYIRGDRSIQANIIEVLNQAFKAPDLLSGEKILDKAKWIFLDNLLSQHYFDFECVLSYGFKLKILERYQEFGSGKGKEVLEQYKIIEKLDKILVN
ncbi:MAG: DUF2764 family protein [Candidatus Zapsychrus exili]|nr:DUF2764 family protein [Candidatus Zapsychrus exili]